MTASEKNISIDTNMPATNNANSCTNFSIKPFSVGMSFVQASEDLSTVLASTSNSSGLNNSSKLDVQVSDDTSMATPAVSVDRGNLSIEKSVTIIASFTPDVQVYVSPCDNDSEGEKQYTRFSIDSIMNERKDSKEEELESKKLVGSMRSTSYKTGGENVEPKKLPVHTPSTSDHILTSEPDKQFNDYAFCDKSSEVKHPQTPINNVPVQSHSPQLPEPAFPYPVQEESMSESMAIDGSRMSLPHPTSQKNSEINNGNHSAKETNTYRFSRRNERHLDSSSGTSDRRFASKVSKTNITRATKKKLAVSESKFTVLNIPNVLQKEPSVKRRKLSIIDVAVLRRRERAQRRVLKSEILVSGGLTSEKCEDDPDSYNSDSEDGKEVDLLVRSGPACKLDLDSRKLEFLKMFKLTTHIGQNSIELQKMVKRKWIIPDVVQEEENTEIFSLNLPVPSNSLSDKIQNHDQKTNFLHLLGLGTVATEVKQEMEEMWIKVVKERVRRKCESSLTKYYQKVFKATKKKHNSVNCCGNEISLALPVVHQHKHQNEEQTSEILGRFAGIQNLSNEHNINTKARNIATGSSKLSRELNKNYLFIPNLDNLKTNKYILNSSKLHKLQEYRSLNFQLDKKAIGSSITSMMSSRFEATDKINPYIIQTDCHQNTSKLQLFQSENEHSLKDYLILNKRIESNQLPVLEKQGVNSRSVANGLDLKEVAIKPSFTWPGLMEIKEAYNKHSKEKFREMVELKEQGHVLADETSTKQGEVKFLERKQRNMYTTLSRIDKEKKELLRAIDQLTHFINYFR